MNNNTDPHTPTPCPYGDDTCPGDCIPTDDIHHTTHEVPTGLL